MKDHFSKTETRRRANQLKIMMGGRKFRWRIQDRGICDMSSDRSPWCMQLPVDAFQVYLGKDPRFLEWGGGYVYFDELPALPHGFLLDVCRYEKGDDGDLGDLLDNIYFWLGTPTERPAAMTSPFRTWVRP